MRQQESTKLSKEKPSGDSATSISMTSSEEEISHQQSGEEESDDDDEEYEVELNDKDNDDGDEAEEGDVDNDTDDNATQSSDDASVASFSAINFTEFVEMYEIDCEYSPEEEAIMWFNSNEYSQFLEQCEDRANEITKQHEAKGEEPSSQKIVRDLLGLEAWTKEGYKKRQKARLSSIDVVLDEQFAQWDNGKEDPTSIAELYQASTSESAVNANTKAKYLEKDVKGFLQSTLKNYDSLVLSMSSKSLSSFRSSSDSIGSLYEDDEEAENAPKKKVVKKVVKKKASDEWSKVDPNAPQPFNKYVKKMPPKKKVPSSRNLQSQSSNRSLVSRGGSSRSLDSSDSRRGPVSLTESAPSSIRSLGSRTGGLSKNGSLGGRRKPEALVAAARLQRQGGSRSIGGLQKHQPGSSKTLNGKKAPPKKKKPQLTTVGTTAVPMKKPLGATPMRVPLSKMAKPKSMKFTRSEILPAYNTPVSSTTDRKNVLARKKKSLQDELKMIEKEMKSTEKLASFKVKKQPQAAAAVKKPASVKKVVPEKTAEKKKNGGLLSRRLLLGKG